MYDFCIIGGGASGMTAAIKSKQLNKNLKVIILEKNQKLGKKLLATGNGRCNLTNKACEDYRRVLEFFDNIGVLTKTDEDGRIYPYTEEAAEVVGALEFQLQNLGVEIRCGEHIVDIAAKDHGFKITLERETVEARNILIATGGKSAPEYGTTGDGYIMAKNLGHKVNRLAPVLAPVECQGDFRRFKGIRQDALVKLIKDGELIAEENGNLQMTEYGLSGICVFDLTRHIRVQANETMKDAMSRYGIAVDFLPNITEESVCQILLSRSRIKGMTAIGALRTLVKKQVAKDILARVGVKEKTLMSTVSQDQIKEIVRILKAWNCRIESVKGWQFAQVTRGGVSFEEVNSNTMESRKIPGLYFAGEVLDYDGPCGGYNLQNAWNTGLTVGVTIGEKYV